MDNQSCTQTRSFVLPMDGMELDSQQVLPLVAGVRLGCNVELCFGFGKCSTAEGGYLALQGSRIDVLD